MYTEYSGHDQGQEEASLCPPFCLSSPSPLLYFILTQETWRFKELFFYAKHLLDTQSELGASCILAVQCHFCLTQLSPYEEE